MKFAGTVRRWRRLRELTQRDAAKRLGVPYRTFQAWELGARTPRGIAKWLIVARLQTPKQIKNFIIKHPIRDNTPQRLYGVNSSTLAAPAPATSPEARRSQARPDSQGQRKKRPAGRKHR